MVTWGTLTYSVNGNMKIHVHEKLLGLLILNGNVNKFSLFKYYQYCSVSKEWKIEGYSLVTQDIMRIENTV